MLFAGIDLHRQTSTIAVMNERGELVKRKKIGTRKEEYESFFRGFNEPLAAALEPVSQWPVYYELLEEMGYTVKLAGPRKVKAIGSAKIKTDTIDATTRAPLLRTDLLPESYIPAREIRDL